MSEGNSFGILFAITERNLLKLNIMKNYYEILGVNKNASDDEIKKAFRTLSKKYHPDRHSAKPENERKMYEEKMKEINEAYATLSDPQKRQEYDNPYASHGGFGDISEMMREAMNHMGFGGFGGFRNRNQQKPKRTGSHIKHEVRVGINEILHGLRTEIRYKRNIRCNHCHGKGGEKKIVCPYCHGQGWIEETRSSQNAIFTSSIPCPHCHGQGFKYEKPCNYCHGSGFEEKEEVIHVDFEPGMMPDTPFIAVGKGNESPDENGVDGNFYAVPVFDFDRSKYNLDNFPHIIHKINLNWIDALLGGKMTLKLEGLGERTVEVKECTKPGDTILLAKQGARIKSNDMFTNDVVGDYILYVDYKFPNKLSDEQKRYLKKIKDIS